jgi:hypothetical protein
VFGMGTGVSLAPWTPNRPSEDNFTQTIGVHRTKATMRFESKISMKRLCMTNVFGDMHQ